MAKTYKSDKIGKWSEDKLSLLNKYLEAYTTIMRTEKWCRGYYYIDAFAGTGKPKAKDEERFVDGSPRLALTVKNPFSGYLFIEKTKWRIKKLESLKEEFNYLKIVIKQGDCNFILDKVIPEFDYSKFARVLLFLDPFGMSVDWQTIKKAAGIKTFELFLNMPIMAINRACLLNDPNNLTIEHMERMNRFCGNTDWQKIMYGDVPTLFGPTKMKNYVDSKKLSSYFTDRLKSIFDQVSAPLIMRNSKNSPLYCLIYAGHKESGKRIVESIFKHFEKLKNTQLKQSLSDS